MFNDNPHLSLLEEHLQILKDGHPIQKPIYDMKVSELVGTEKMLPKEVIIIEGLFALQDELAPYGDNKSICRDRNAWQNSS